LAQVSLKIGGETNSFDVLFREPWLFDRPVSGEARAFKWYREYDEYTKDSLGGHLTVGFPARLDEFTRGTVTYTYEDSYISDVRPNAAQEIKDMEGRSVTSSVTLGLTRNSTDKLWNPTKGSINSASIEYAGGILGGDNYFTKYLGRSAWHFPLFWDTVFSMQGRWGYIDQREGGDLPVYEKFFLGGMNTVRGFEYADISPRDPATGDKIGGEKMMVYNVEFRFPLIKEQGIVGLVFFDAGNVFTAEESYTFKGIRMSVGGGVRWYSPMGPLRLEWGYNLDPQEDEVQSKWDFTIGTMF
jgi:outer membrane protein insertion porin family